MNTKRGVYYLADTMINETEDCDTLVDIARLARHAVEYFFSQWVPLEQLLNRVSSKNSPKVRGAFNINTLKRLNLLDKECINQIVSLRKIRNVLIHDIEIPEADYINRQGDEAQSLFHKLSEQFAAPA